MTTPAGPQHGVAAQALPDGWENVDYVLPGRPITVFQGTEIPSEAEAPQSYAALIAGDALAGPSGLDARHRFGQRQSPANG